MAKIKIVVSGINMLDSGLLTIYQNCLQQLSKYNQDQKIEAIALVGNKKLFDFDNIDIIEFPKSKKSWFFRIYYEYFYFKKLSKQLQPDIWFSLHDTTPNVVCSKQFVYCHNPCMFYKPTLKDWKLDFKIAFFNYTYKYLYQVNIKKNKAVFVQQHWIKQEFERIFNINNVLIAPPEQVTETAFVDIDLDINKIHFFYPTFPRVFKNIEIISNAIKLLPINIQNKIQVHVTFDKSDNKYSRYLFDNFAIDQIKFTGKQNRATVFGYYKAMDCLLFPSKLETWGLPISEAKSLDKPMLVADLPYAKETVGNYQKVSFFDVDKPEDLGFLMEKFVEKTIAFDGNKYPYDSSKDLNNWNAIFDYMIQS